MDKQFRNVFLNENIGLINSSHLIWFYGIQDSAYPIAWGPMASKAPSQASEFWQNSIQWTWENVKFSNLGKQTILDKLSPGVLSMMSH